VKKQETCKVLFTVLRSEVLTPVSIKFTVLWDVMMCRVVFYPDRDTRSLRPLISMYYLHGVTTQKIKEAKVTPVTGHEGP
jgi:hypothetical protein